MAPVKVQVSEVFVTSGFPELTFIPPVVYPRLHNALSQRAGGVIVEGPSGIGKSVAVTRVIEKLGEAAGRVTVLSAREPKHHASIHKVAADKPEGIWIIEDFHNLPHDKKVPFAEAIKYLADERDVKCKIVLVGINNAGHGLIHSTPDLLTRVTVVSFERNPDDLVEQLIRTGEQWLNIRIPDHDKLVEEARGSFLLAQLLCRAACDAAGLIEEHPGPDQFVLPIDLGKVINDVLEDLARQFGGVCWKFARGKKPKRAGRAPYLQCLRWLAEGNEWSIQLERIADLNPRYRGSVIQILKKGFLRQHIEGDPDIARLIHLSEENYLSVEDPRFVFYIRHVDWTEYREEIGFGRESSNTYDFALSFAGPQRPLARALCDELADDGFAVFFDEVERDRMLGQDLRTYLAPIYASGAEFVLVLLGREYPRRLWTAFEEDQYHKRVPEGSVIPVWYQDEAPSFASELTSKGGIVFSSSAPSADELEKAVEDLGSALDKRLGRLPGVIRPP